ncbi:hypothetical protein ACFLWL_02410 [Chloroflexota bacterium]
MPGKSRHRKGKYSFQSKKGKGRPSRPPILAHQPAVTQTSEPVSTPEVSVSSASVPSPATKPVVIWHPYITTELRTIGILAGIMLIVLIVLALVLS